MFIANKKTANDTILTIMVYVLLLSVSALVLFTGLTRQASAQDVPSLLRMDILPDPEVPGPGQAVTFTAKSYTLSLNTAMMTWKVNGEVVRSARGAISYSMQAGMVGSATAIEVTAENEGRTLTAVYMLRPQYVGIVWEAETYTPILYRGKALHSPNSQVRFTAIPVLIDSKGTMQDEDDLQYEWSIDRSVQPDLSGYGRQSVLLSNMRVLHPLQVSVSVRSRDNKLIARNSITVPVVQPQILLYEQHRLLGVRYQHALGGEYVLKGSEATLVAEPYNMSVAVRDEASLVFDWRVGQESIDARGIITLRPEGSGQGTAPLSLVLRNGNELLQSARTTVQVIFEATDPESQNFLTL